MGKVKRKSSSMLLKRPRTITAGESSANHATSLKPQRTRQLIRRFHILQKSKCSILKLLGKYWGKVVNEDNYLGILKSNSVIFDTYHKSIDSTLKTINLKSPLPISFNESDSDKHLTQLLGQIDAEIEKRGGLQTYQTASTLGQVRGGDSSKKLMEWLQKLEITHKDLTALEIGSLSSQNLISTSCFFSKVTRIDLRSQEPNLIIEQDFMKRPLPKSEDEKFNLVSCSLVINFVPNALDRGKMLMRIREFLKIPTKTNGGMNPMLFLVLPLPCVSNSRYFDNDKLDKIMDSLGFKKLEYYEAKKVAYWLWEWNGTLGKTSTFEKKEIHGGSKRNNFCIVIG